MQWTDISARAYVFIPMYLPTNCTPWTLVVERRGSGQRIGVDLDNHPQSISKRPSFQSWLAYEGFYPIGEVSLFLKMAPRNVLLIGLVPTALLHSLYYIKVLQGANRDLGLGLLKVFKEQGYNVFGTIRPQTRSDPSFEDVSWILSSCPGGSKIHNHISLNPLGLPSSTLTTWRRTVLLPPPKATAMIKLSMFW